MDLKYHIVNTAAVLIFSYVSAFTMNQFIKYSFIPEPVDPYTVRAGTDRFTEERKSFEEYSPIIDAGFFRLHDEEAAPAELPEEPAVETGISELYLIGTITGPSSIARAIIRKGRRQKRRVTPRNRRPYRKTAGARTEDDNGSDVYRLWSDVHGYRLVRIDGSKVYLKANGKVEVLDMFDEKSNVDRNNRQAPKTSAGSPKRMSRTVSKAEVQQRVFGSIDSALKGLRAGPYRVNGKIEGYKLFRVRPNNILYKYGARSGDIVKRVNGLRIDSTEKLLSMWSSVKSDSMIKVDIQRGNSIIQYDFKITD